MAQEKVNSEYQRDPVTGRTKVNNLLNRKNYSELEEWEYFCGEYW